MTRIAINGLGRIGRTFMKLALESPELEIVAANDISDPDSLAYLIKYDSAYGKYDGSVKVEHVSDEVWLQVGAHRLRLFAERHPEALPWKALDVQIVVEASGAFETYVDARRHLDAGAAHVVLTAPAKDDDADDARTVLMGVNPQDLALSRVSSNGSCTTNSAASVIDVLREHIGIRKAILNTVHGYTATQTLVDTSVRGRDLRRGRAAAANIVPATTGAAIAVTRAIPRLRDRFDGVALRVPVLIGSLSSIVAVTERPTTAEEVNAVLSRSRAGKPVEWRLGHDHGPARQQRHRRRSARRDCRPVTDEGHRWRSVCGVQEGTDPTIVRAARRKSQSQDYR